MSMVLGFQFEYSTKKGLRSNSKLENILRKMKVFFSVLWKYANLERRQVNTITHRYS